MFEARLKKLTSSLTSCEVFDASGLVQVDEGLSRACSMIRRTNERKGIVYVIGNGGSAGIASHFCNDLVKALHIGSQTLYDSNLLTCLANDLGYEHVFSFPLDKMLTENDLLVAISSSGKSPNILNGAKVAKEKNAGLITLSGFQSTNPLRLLGNLNFWIDQTDYGLVEASHFFLLHSVIDLWGHYRMRDLLAKEAECPK